MLSLTSFYFIPFSALISQCETQALKILFLNFLFLENWIVILATDGKDIRVRNDGKM